MSVLIKDMTMPEDCPICPLSYWNAGGSFTGCALKKRFFSDEEMRSDSKPEFCPLVEFSLPRGEWTDVSEKVWVSEIGFTSAWECSNCHTIFPFYSNYCPNCGAKMEEDGEE